MAKYPTRKRIFDLAGESMANADGSSRQEILRDCEPGMAVELLRQPDNPHDPNAVLAVVSGRGGVGYISRGDVLAIATALDAGHVCAAHIQELTGGMFDYPSLGCRICITWEGQTPLDPKDIRPEQTAYHWDKPSGGCMGVVLVATALPMLTYLAS